MRNRKWYRELIVMLLLLVMCPVIASAATNGKIVASEVYGKAGDTVTVDIRLEDNPGIISAAVEVYYDSSKLDLISVDNKKMMPESSFSKNYDSYPYCASWTDAYSSDNMSEDGVLMTMTFKILEDAKSGAAPIEVKFDPANMFNCDMQTQAFTSVDGAVIISASENENETINKPKDEENNAPDQTDGDDLKQEGLYLSYSDLEPNGWYRRYVEYMLEKGYMNGMGGNTFAPNGNVTRAQLVTILYRIAGSPRVAGMNNPFDDVAKGTWYTDAVVWAAENGIVNGVTASAFAPNNNITREQLATILYRYHGGLKPLNNNLYSFKDREAISSYARDAMNWAVGEGILNGSDGLLLPSASATRVQTAAMLTRYLENEKIIPVPTDPTIKDY